MRTVRTSICPHCNNRHDLQERPDTGRLEFVSHHRRSITRNPCPGSGEVVEITAEYLEYEIGVVQDEW
jgi:hypothetical protein